MVVGQQLHLDVPRRQDATFEIHRRVAKCRTRLGACGAQGAREVGGIRDRAHALASTAGHGLQHQGIADTFGNRPHLGLWHVVADRLFRAWHDRHASLDRDLPRRRLAPHQGDGLGRGPDERQVRIPASGGEVLVLGQEAVSRVDRICPRTARGFDDAVDAEVTVAGWIGTDRVGLIGHPDVERGPVALGIDGDALKPHVATGPDDTDRNLAAVRDQDLLHQTETLAILSLRGD